MKRRSSLSQTRKTAASLSACLSAMAFVGVAADLASAQQAARPVASPRSSQVRVAVAETPVNPGAAAGTVHRDPQVVQAGAILHHNKRVCPQGGCGLGGQCQGTCVVRPGRFGYYATQWRAWPGDQGVQQASLEEMTPVSPPASAIPAVDEEALMPSSLMPAEDDVPFGSDNFGFEPVEPAEPLPPAIPSDEGSLPDEPAPAEQAPTPSKPSLFDPEPTAPDAGVKPESEEKPKESLDNLFDEFGRTSANRSGAQLSRRLTMANHEFNRRKAEQMAIAEPSAAAAAPAQNAWKPRQLPSAATSRPLAAAPATSSRVVPATAQQRVSPSGNPLR